MRFTSVKCDRCGVIADNGQLGDWGRLRLAAPKQDWLADLCPPCSEQIRSDVTFLAAVKRRSPKAKAKP